MAGDLEGRGGREGDAEADLVQADLGALVGHQSKIARQRQDAAPRNGVTVDRSHDRPGKGEHLEHHPIKLADERVQRVADMAGVVGGWASTGRQTRDSARETPS